MAGEGGFSEIRQGSAWGSFFTPWGQVGGLRLLKCPPLKVSAGVHAGIWTHFSREFSEVSYTRFAEMIETLVVHKGAVGRQSVEGMHSGETALPLFRPVNRCVRS